MSNFKSLHHSFDIDLASAYGVDAAIMIHHFQHWIMINKAQNINFFEGRTWTYQKLDQIAAHFPYYSVKQVERIICKLVSLNILIKGNYNKNPFDRTVWYAFAKEEDFCISRNREIDNSESGNEISRNREMRFPEIGNCNKDKDTKQDTKKKIREEQAPPPSSPSKKKKAKEEPELLPFGTYVQLKEGEYQSLSQQLGKEYVDYYIEAINNYVPNNKPYKDYAATIRSWYNRDKAKGSLPKSQNLHMSAGSSPEYLEKNKRICEAVEKQLKDQFNSFVYFQASPTKAILYNKNKYIDKSYDYSSYDPIQLKEILIRDLEICFPGSRNILLPPQKRPTQVTNLINNLANQYRPQEEIA